MSEAGTPSQCFEISPPSPEGHEQAQEKAAEGRPSGQESSLGKQAPKSSKATAATIPQIPQIPTTLTAQAPGTRPQTPSPTSQLTADDVDLIEKEWVQRAKAIVAETQEDPYRQKKEMSKVKADYIHKRFKKVIKTDDAVTT